MIWHRRLGHINFGDLMKMKNGLILLESSLMIILKMK